MDEATKAQEARAIFNTLCQTLDNMKWTYSPNPDKMVVRTGARGEDLPMDLFLVVDPDMRVMCVRSPMPYQIPQDTRDVVGVAVNIANLSMLNGCFEYDRDHGHLLFRAVAPFHNCQLSQEVCRYMVTLTCSMVDRFNDKFLSVAKGNMTLAAFKEFAFAPIATS